MTWVNIGKGMSKPLVISKLNLKKNTIARNQKLPLANGWSNSMITESSNASNIDMSKIHNKFRNISYDTGSMEVEQSMCLLNSSYLL